MLQLNSSKYHSTGVLAVKQFSGLVIHRFRDGLARDAPFRRSSDNNPMQVLPPDLQRFRGLSLASSDFPSVPELLKCISVLNPMVLRRPEASKNNPQPATHLLDNLSLERPRLLSHHHRVDALLLTLAAVWVSAVFAAPLLENRAIYDFFSVICHQITARSWFLAGVPLAACIRCTSIYTGFLCALALRLPPVNSFLKVSLALMLLEVTVAQFWLDSELARSISGLLVGLAAAGFVSKGVRELISRRVGYRTFSPMAAREDTLEHM
jgi:hypothetical protein